MSLPRPPIEGSIPGWLQDLSAVVAASLSTAGRVIEANRGLLELMDADDPDRLEPIRGAFHTPPFDRLTKGSAPDAWTLVHEGRLNLGPRGDEAATVEGWVWRRGDELAVLAEHDLTSQRRLNEEVLGLNQELSEAQRELTRELRRRKEAEAALEAKASELERSNEALEAFAHSVSHDLKEPLRTVSGFLDLLSKRHDAVGGSDAAEMVEQAQAGAERMEAMIQGLLEYSRVDTQGGQPEPVAVERSLQDALENLTAALEASDGEVHYEALPHVLADASQLTQLLQNLVSNALKFSGEGRPRVEIWATREGDMWRIHVRDDGVGIPEEEQASIFEVFERGSSGADAEGTGVGLSLCQRIVQRHGGEMDVESEPGEGTVFSFTLPAPEGDLEDAEGPSVSTSGPSSA